MKSGDKNGLMGVPLTVMFKTDFHSPDADWELVDCVRPILKGKPMYQRLIIRRRFPKMQGFVRFQDTESEQNLYMNVNAILTVSSDGTAETLLGTLKYGIPYADFCKKIDNAIRGIDEEEEGRGEG